MHCHTHTRMARFASAMALPLIVGCREAAVEVPTEGITSRTNTSALQAIRANPARSQAVDGQFAEIEALVPGFAGYTIVGDTFVIHATAGADASALQKVVRARVGSVFQLSARPVQIKRVAYSFLQLSAWRDLLAGAPSTGLVSSDVDEAANRVSVGVESDAVASTVRERLIARGVPEAAMNVFVRSRIVPVTTLQDYIRPTIGGIRIESNAQVCTLGFWVRLAESGDYFVTNSHCTPTRYGLNANFYERQPTYYPDATFGQIGYEYIDPPLNWDYPNCDELTYCRFSDASVFRYTTANFSRTLIARTDTLSIVPGNLGGITLAAPYFDVTGEVPLSNLVVGQGLNKVGSSTGWVAGGVTATCQRAYQTVPVNHYLECQYEANMTIGDGDSGSPIFQWYGGATGYSVSLAGIVWGRNNYLRTVQTPAGAIDIGSSLTFSPLPMMRIDLGNFWVTP